MGSLTMGIHPTLVQNYTVTADVADLDTPFRLRRIECKRGQWESLHAVVIYVLFVGCVVRLYYFHETSSPPSIRSCHVGDSGDLGKGRDILTMLLVCVESDMVVVMV